MIIEIGDYEKERKLILDHYETKGLQRTCEICLFSSIPFIAMYAFLDEELGGFGDKIKELLEFYGYTEYSNRNA